MTNDAVPPTSAKGSHFVAIYRWRVAPEHEATFRDRWRATTLRGREHGALLSCLTHDANGEFVAIGLWPSEEARAAAFVAMGSAEPWPGVQRIEEVKLTVEGDLWAGSPFKNICRA